MTALEELVDLLAQRTKRFVEREIADLKAAHALELAARDEKISELVREVATLRDADQAVLAEIKDIRVDLQSKTRQLSRNSEHVARLESKWQARDK